MLVHKNREVVKQPNQFEMLGCKNYFQAVYTRNKSLISWEALSWYVQEYAFISIEHIHINSWKKHLDPYSKEKL